MISACLPLLAMYALGARQRNHEEQDAAFPGIGQVQFWIVNETCNRLWVVPRRGRTRAYRLRQFEFENGDDFFTSGYVLDAHRLVVTHQHGAYLINDHGRVLAQDSVDARVLTEVDGLKVTRQKADSEDLLDFTADQTPYAWNGKRLLTCQVDGLNLSETVSLFTGDLRLTQAIEFKDEIVLTASWTDSNVGWIQLGHKKDWDQRRIVWISNQGRISFDHGVHWH